MQGYVHDYIVAARVHEEEATFLRWRTENVARGFPFHQWSKLLIFQQAFHWYQGTEGALTSLAGNLFYQRTLIIHQLRFRHLYINYHLDAVSNNHEIIPNARSISKSQRPSFAVEPNDCCPKSGTNRATCFAKLSEAVVYINSMI